MGPRVCALSTLGHRLLIFAQQGMCLMAAEGSGWGFWTPPGWMQGRLCGRGTEVRALGLLPIAGFQGHLDQALVFVEMGDTSA